MEKFILPSGAKFEVQPLSYEGAWAVSQSIIKEIEKTQIDLKGLDLSQIMASDVMIMKGPICSILASNVVLESVKQCFAKCRYNDAKIDSMTFEKKEARGDYLFACFYALKENVSPFFGSLVSLLQMS